MQVYKDTLRVCCVHFSSTVKKNTSYAFKYFRYELIGPMKITCLKDGSYNSEPPSCQLIQEKVVPSPTPPRPIPTQPILENPDLVQRPNFPRRVYPKIKIEDSEKPIRKYKKQASLEKIS